MNSARLAAQIGFFSMVVVALGYAVVWVFSGDASWVELSQVSVPPPVAEPARAVKDASLGSEADAPSQSESIVVPSRGKKNDAYLVLEQTVDEFMSTYPRTQSVTIQPGQTVGGVLEAHGASSVLALTRAARPHVDFSKVKPGQRIDFEYLGAVLTEIRYPIDEDNILIVKADDVGHPKVETKQYGRRPVRVMLKVDSSLWNAAVQFGFRPAQVLELAKVFENELDLNTDLQPGAVFEVVVEALENDGVFVRFDQFRAVTLTNAGKEYEAFFYASTREIDTGWYTRQGVSLERVEVLPRKSASQRAFGPPFERGKYKKYQTNLRRRPLKDGELQISGDFYQKRCKGRCRHSALDIRAAQGTPLMALGTGVVRAITSARSLCGFGVQLEVKDETGQRWRTLYCHMSKISVKKGQRVKKGQMIGLSGGKPGTYGAGNTTAPHLHLELRKRTKEGRWVLVDPLPHIHWAPFRTKVRYTKGYEPKPSKPTPKPPIKLKGNVLTAFQQQIAEAEQVVARLERP